MIIASYLIAGVFAGLTAGLFGVGGGLVVVPILIFAFEAQGFPNDILTHMAIGTSLATIVFTSTSSVISHHKKGAVLWSVFKPMSAGIALGAVIGVLTIVQLDGQLLKKMFGVFAVGVSLKMLISPLHYEGRDLPSPPLLAVIGVFVAWVSSLFGIGGGTLTVPLLSRYRIAMKQVVGTAAACGLPIALFASISNMLIGQGVLGRPEWSVGYVYLPALLGISLASVYFAKVGAHFAHRLSSVLLRRLFSIFLMLVGIRFLII
jgi:uncharacterized membrane protein YfcA